MRAWPVEWLTSGKNNRAPASDIGIFLTIGFPVYDFNVFLQWWSSGINREKPQMLLGNLSIVGWEKVQLPFFLTFCFCFILFTHFISTSPRTTNNEILCPEVWSCLEPDNTTWSHFWRVSCGSNMTLKRLMWKRCLFNKGQVWSNLWG